LQLNQARVFVTFSYFHPSLIFADKAGSLLLAMDYVRASTVVGSVIVCKY